MSEGSSRSLRRVALVAPRKLKAFFGGASGGMQGGPRRGRSPITGPTLPRAAQASQLRRRAKQSARRAETIKRTSLAVRLNRAPRRRPNFAGWRNREPEGQNQSKEHPPPCGEIARRAGVPTSPEGETECPKGRKGMRESGARACQADLRKPDFFGLPASKFGF